ncbi:hypothetical protein C1H46_008836 [Malus baccata]|uniref:Sugar phosphate transporter domain-containing protein n=1 Tax=Malus baccata TaxID=106549 RepID=A0A540N3L0_MALBA|nr:hypothetical protein C1H46_008836 [Malus baccata]
MTEKQPSTIPWTTVRMVAAWYGSNIGVLLLNKYLLTNYGFKFPIFLTLRHMAGCTVLSYAAIVPMEVVPLQRVKSKVQLAKISGLSVVCGNVSLKYLPVSFNESVGATTTFFTAVFAFSIIKKREALLTYTALIPVVAGVIIISGGKPRLDEPAAPIAVTLLLPATLLMEKNVIEITTELARKDIRLIWYLIFDSSLAYFVNLTNFLVTKHTSALTLQVMENAKGAVAVVVSILVFKNPMSSMGMVGYALTVLGVPLYSEAKKRYS